MLTEMQHNLRQNFKQFYQIPLLLWGIFQTNPIPTSTSDLSNRLIDSFFCWYYGKNNLSHLNLQFLEITTWIIKFNNKNYIFPVRSYYSFFKKILRTVAKNQLEESNSITVTRLQSITEKHLKPIDDSLQQTISIIWNESIRDPAFLFSLQLATGRSFEFNPKKWQEYFSLASDN